MRKMVVNVDPVDGCISPEFKRDVGRIECDTDALSKGSDDGLSLGVAELLLNVGSFLLDAMLKENGLNGWCMILIGTVGAKNLGSASSLGKCPCQPSQYSRRP
jgi:hypothetical protein